MQYVSAREKRRARELAQSNREGITFEVPAGGGSQAWLGTLYAVTVNVCVCLAWKKTWRQFVYFIINESVRGK